MIDRYLNAMIWGYGSLAYLGSATNPAEAPGNIQHTAPPGLMHFTARTSLMHHTAPPSQLHHTLRG